MYWLIHTLFILKLFILTIVLFVHDLMGSMLKIENLLIGNEEILLIHFDDTNYDNY